jgi:hypothetical protein
METTIYDFVEWAWARHHNILSWYIRPLFLIPFCYFSFKKSWVGILATLIGLLTSMFWFPAPETMSESVKSMLEAEKQYLTSEWTVFKIFMALLVPLSFGLLGYSFWNRSIRVGIVIITFMLATKIVWTFYFAPTAGALVHLVPALVGLGLVKVFVLYRWKEHL